MDKDALIQCVIGQLEEQLKTMQNATRASHDAATGSESKSEGKYDTRGLEASYLAEAQAEQCEKILQAIRSLKGFVAEKVSPETQIQVGSIVELESDGDLGYYMLLPHGGGIAVEYDDVEITTVTPETPLYQALAGNKQGDLIEYRDSLILEVI
ncbi:MAG: transcription elongation factor GreAB [Akkermansiaceae bacterium]